MINQIQYFPFRKLSNISFFGAIFFVFLFSVSENLNAQIIPAQNIPKMEVASRLLKMTPEEAKKQIEKMSVKETAVMITQIRFITRKHNRDMDRVYYLLKHLESIKANALAQKRLNNLLWVLAISVGLFSAFLIYIILDQKKAIGSLQKLLSGSEENVSRANTVYRGD